MIKGGGEGHGKPVIKSTPEGNNVVDTGDILRS